MVNAVMYQNKCYMDKFGYSKKATKFEKNRQILSGRFFLIVWPSQNI